MSVEVACHVCGEFGPCVHPPQMATPGTKLPAEHDEDQAGTEVEDVICPKCGHTFLRDAWWEVLEGVDGEEVTYCGKCGADVWISWWTPSPVMNFVRLRL